MTSPFAGMDPFLEAHWPDVHHRLVTYSSDWLNEHLPSDLVASTEERVAIDADSEGVHRIGPDVRVFSPSTADVNEGVTGGAIVAPFKLVVDLDPVIESFVKILDPEGLLITVIELVGPANKRGDGMTAYRKKRDELLSAGVHVVEVDLVRGGNWRTLLEPARLPANAVTPYRAIVRQGGQRFGGYVFPIHLDQPADDVPIPLRAHDTELKLPLQSLITQVYAKGRYGQRLKYSDAILPKWSEGESGVVSGVLARRGQ